MTTLRSLLWCSALVATGVGATFWALGPSTPQSARAARQAPRASRTEARPLEPAPGLERAEPRPAQVETVRPAPAERQLMVGAAPAIADAGAASHVARASSVAPSELPDDAIHRAIPGMPPARGPRPFEPAHDETTSDEPEPERRAPPRRVEITAFRVWQQPGLCAKPEGASEAHGSLMRSFRVVDGEDGGRFYVDPRLRQGAESSLLVHLEMAEREARAELGLSARRPDVFVYSDLELLLAAACTNDDVVAYYDGALHVVLNRDDVRESVVHEYAHHALMTNGILGPAWAQEGIAMHVASETWWRTPRWLERVADQPFSIDVMEREVPYTLSSEQAVLFYVQAGAMVACAAREEPEGLVGLTRALRASHSGGELSYDLEVPTTPASLRACVARLLRGIGSAGRP